MTMSVTLLQRTFYARAGILIALVETIFEIAKHIARKSIQCLLAPSERLCELHTKSARFITRRNHFQKIPRAAAGRDDRWGRSRRGSGAQLTTTDQFTR